MRNPGPVKYRLQRPVFRAASAMQRELDQELLNHEFGTTVDHERLTFGVQARREGPGPLPVRAELS